MQRMAAIRIARRELRGGFRGFRVFVACLALGVAAVAAVGTVRSAIEAGLSREGGNLLGGDAEIEFSYRFADEAELGWMHQEADRISEVVDFRSMATTNDGEMPVRALTQVKAVDRNYPLYGKVVLDPPIPLSEALSPEGDLPGAVIQPSLAARLQLAPGDRIRLGSTEFQLTALLQRAPDSIVSGPMLGPRTIVLTSALADSGLLAPGSLFSSHYRMRLPDDADLREIANQARDRFADRGLQWQDRTNANSGVREFVRRVGAFLVLVGLAGLVVGGIGVAAAVRVFLDRRVSTIAALKTLGAERSTVFAVYLAQVGVMILAGIVIGNAVGLAVPLLLLPLAAQYLPVPVETTIYLKPLLEASIYGALAGTAFALWSLARTGQIRPAELFRDGSRSGGLLPPPRLLAVIGLLVLVLIAAASWFSGAVRLTLWSAAGILACMAVLSVAGIALRLSLNRLAATRIFRGRPVFRIAVGSIGGIDSDAIPVVLSLGLGLTVLASIGQVSANLNNSIRNDLPEVAPLFFAVDIQNDQLSEFLELASEDPRATRVDTAPMLRGVITRINGASAREVAGDHWALRGDRGVTYSAVPPDDAVLSSGSWWPENYTGEPLVSFSEEEGRELGLELDDRLTVNILGRDITARVASFRVVDFRDAGVGFIMSMNPSALAGAPHTHIATIYADQDAETGLLQSVGAALPNVTMISVREGIARFREILANLVAATILGSTITLATGFVVLIGVAAAGEKRRTYDSAILKALGAVRLRILSYVALRSVILGAAAGSVAILAGGAIGWAVMRFVMEQDFTFEPVSATLTVGGGAVVSLLAGLLFALGPLNASPSRVLRARD